MEWTGLTEKILSSVEHSQGTAFERSRRDRVSFRSLTEIKIRVVEKLERTMVCVGMKETKLV